jgi:hypothetical protein
MTSPLVRPFVILVLMAPLAACVREQRHQLYACNSGSAATAAHVITCMSREGYRADFGAARCRGRAAPYDVAICYRPRGIIASLGFSIERLFRSS